MRTERKGLIDQCEICLGKFQISGTGVFGAMHRGS